MEVVAQDIYVGRQPILDRQGQLFAYEVLFRSGATGGAVIGDDLAATASVIEHVFFDLGLETALGPYPGFVNLDARMLMSEALEVLPPEKFVLEILETTRITAEIVARARDLKQKGYRIALDDFVGVDEAHQPLLELADIVKVDLLQLGNGQLRELTATLKRWPAKLLAEKVDSDEQARHCRELGYELFQGYYFAKPTVIAGKKLSHSETTLLRLLGLIIDDADTMALEQVFKEQPALSLNLIRLTNSAAAGLPHRIASLGQAITMLGRRQLQRWLQLLLYTSPNSTRQFDSPLLRLAATRGRLMELLAESLPRGSRELRDYAFMTGILSLMPALMHVAIADIIRPLNLDPGVRDALEKREGPLGTLLVLTEKMEQNDLAACRALIETVPALSMERVSASLTQALAWANAIGEA